MPAETLFDVDEKNEERFRLARLGEGQVLYLILFGTTAVSSLVQLMI